MNLAIRILSWLANIGIVLVLFYVIVESRGGRDAGLALVLLSLPLVNMIALYNGPDREERKLAREVRKAELRRRLAELEGGDKKKK